MSQGEVVGKVGQNVKIRRHQMLRLLLSILSISYTCHIYHRNKNKMAPFWNAVQPL